MQVVLYSPQLRQFVRDFKLVGVREIVSPYNRKIYAAANFITGEEHDAVMKASYAKLNEQKKLFWW